MIPEIESDQMNPQRHPLSYGGREMPCCSFFFKGPFSFPIGFEPLFSAAGPFWRPRFGQDTQPEPSKRPLAKKNAKSHMLWPREILGAADRSWLRRPERNGI